MSFKAKRTTGFGGDSEGMPEGDLVRRYEVLPSYDFHSFPVSQHVKLDRRLVFQLQLRPMEDPSINKDRS